MWRHWYVVVESADGENLIGPYATRREATRVADGQSGRPLGAVSVQLHDRIHVPAGEPHRRF